MMSTNFAFLSGSRKCLDWFDCAVQAEEYLWNDPQTTGVKIRYISEMILNSLCEDVGLEVGKRMNIEAKIDYLAEMRVLPLSITPAFHRVRDVGNTAAHPDPKKGICTTAMAREGLERLYTVAAWYYTTYVDRQLRIPEFSPYVFSCSEPSKPVEQTAKKTPHNQVGIANLGSDVTQEERATPSSVSARAPEREPDEGNAPKKDASAADRDEKKWPGIKFALATRDRCVHPSSIQLAGQAELNDAVFDIYRILEAARRIAIQEHRSTEALDRASVEMDRAVAIGFEPYRLAVLGAFNAGKSTLVNSLVGGHIAYTNALCATCLPTGYFYSARPNAKIEFNSGSVAEMSVDDFLSLTQDKRDDAAWVNSVRCARVGFPSDFLKTIEPWDVPGIGGNEKDELKAVEFIERIGGAVWVLDATLLGNETIHEPIRILQMKGIRMVAAVNMIDRVDEADIPDIVSFIEQAYEGAFCRVCPVSAKVPGLKNGVYLSTLVEAIHAELIAPSEANRQMRANLAVANAAQFTQRVLEQERSFHWSFVGFVRHIQQNLSERRSYLLSLLPAWISEESGRALQSLENRAIDKLAGGYDSVAAAFEILQQQAELQEAWKQAYLAVGEKAVNLWQSLWFESVSLSLDSVPSVQLSIPTVEGSLETKAIEEQAVMDGVAAGGKAAAVAGVIAAALYIIHWPVIFVGLPIGFLEWWRKRSALRAGFNVKEVECRLHEAVHELKGHFENSLEPEIRKLVEVQTDEATQATIREFAREAFGGVSVTWIQENERHYQDHISSLKTICTAIRSQYSIPEPDDWTKRPLIVSPDNLGAAKWAGFLTADLNTVDIILQRYWSPAGSILGHLAPQTCVRILTSCPETEWTSASEHLRKHVEKWNGKCEIRVVATDLGDSLALNDVWVITKSEALICHEPLDSIGQRTCVFDTYPDGVFAAQNQFAELWQGKGEKGQYLKILIVR